MIVQQNKNNIHIFPDVDSMCFYLTQLKPSHVIIQGCPGGPVTAKINGLCPLSLYLRHNYDINNSVSLYNYIYVKTEDMYQALSKNNFQSHKIISTNDQIYKPLINHPKMWTLYCPNVTEITYPLYSKLCHLILQGEKSF